MYQISPQKNEIKIRPWKNESDYKFFNTLGNLYGQTYRVNNSISANDAKSWLEAQDGFEPEKMIFIVENNNEPIALQCFYPLRTVDQNIIFRIWMAIHPDWTRSSALVKCFATLENKIMTQAKKLHYQNIDIQCIYHDNEKWRQQLLESMGFESKDYYFEMTKPINEYLLTYDIPEKITIKPADSIYKEFEILKFESLIVGEVRGYAGLTNEIMHAIRQQDTYNPYLWKIAWDGDNIIGLVTNFIDEKENKLLNRKRGYTEKITCHPSYRNTNISRALFSESIKMFREMGMEEIAFDVDIMNEKEELSMAESFGFKAKKYYVGMNKKIELAI